MRKLISKRLFAVLMAALLFAALGTTALADDAPVINTDVPAALTVIAPLSPCVSVSWAFEPFSSPPTALAVRENGATVVSVQTRVSGCGTVV